MEFTQLEAISNIIGALGVGGFIAVLALFNWRKDRQETQKLILKLCSDHEERLNAIIKEDMQLRRDYVAALQENTRSNTQLAERIKRLCDVLDIRNVVEGAKRD